MKRSMEILIACAIALILIAPMPAMATNGYQLIGVGSYQKSLGGAVTANPGTAMTAVTNPAGLACIEERADFSIELFMPDRETDFLALGGGKVISDAKEYGIPSLGWMGPIGKSGKFFFGGGMYATSGLGVDYPQTIMMLVPADAFGPGNPSSNSDALWDGYSAISFWQMAPGLAWNMNDKLSLGVALNLDYEQVAFKQRVLLNNGTTEVTIDNFDLSKTASAFGFGLSFGLLYEIGEQWRIGFSYKSKQCLADLEYNLAQGDVYVNDAAGLIPGPSGKYKLDLDFPQQAAFGLAFKANANITISADIKWIEWSDTLGNLSVEGPGGTCRVMDPQWDDQFVYAVGVAWGVNERLNLRFGANFGESPVKSDNMFKNLVLPAVVEQHYTIGGDIQLDKHWNLGFHYMYAPENTFTAVPSANPLQLPGSKISMEQSSFGANVCYKF